MVHYGEIEPNEAIVSSQNTFATNGEASINFDSSNWEYDSEEGLVTINVLNNPNEEDKITWLQYGEDEFIITYIYDENEEINISEISSIATSKIILYDNQEIIKENTLSQVVEEQFGEVITLDVSDYSIPKGSMYINEDTQYELFWKLKIPYIAVADKIKIEASNDYIDDISSTPSYYLKTHINKEELKNVFGLSGTIKIYNLDGQDGIEEITGENIEEINEEIVITYPENVKNIMIETSAPIKEGNINVYHEKKIKSDSYGENIEELSLLKIPTKIETYKTENLVSSKEQNTEVFLIEPSTNLNLEINNNTIYSAINNNVNFSVILNTNSYYNKLFKDPVIEIELPEEITEILINDIDLLYEEDLDILSYEVITNVEGQKIIKVILSGEQTKYSINNPQGGANILINAQIQTKKAIPNVSKKIKISCENGEENVSQQNTFLNIISPANLLNLNTVEIDGKEKTTIIEDIPIRLATNANAKSAKINFKLNNNYGSELSNIEMIGRIPTLGENADNLSLVNTFANELQGAIILNGIAGEVYYSENANAIATDLTWTQSVTDFSRIKSYKIVPSENLQNANSIQLEYNLLIPAGLDFEKSVYNTLITKYTYNEQLLQKNQIIELTTGQGPEVNINIIPQTLNQEEVYGGQIVKYNFEIINDSDKTLEDIDVEYIIPEGAVYTKLEIETGEFMGISEYYEYYPETEKIEWNIPNLLAGQKNIKEIEIKVDNIEQSTSTINNIVNVKTSLEGLDEKTVIATNSLIQIVKKANINVKMEPITDTINSLRENEMIGYQIYIENISNFEINEIILQNYLPANTKYDYCYLLDLEKENGIGTEAIYNDQIKLIELNIDKIEANSLKTIILQLKVDSLSEGITSVSIKNKVLVSLNNIINYESNEINHQVKVPNLNISQTSQHQEVLYSGDDVKYIINIKNEGEAYSLENIQNIVPEQIEVLKYTYYINSEWKTVFETFNSNINVKQTIEIGETLTIEIEGKVKELEEGINEVIITNTATTAKGKSASFTNTIKRHIEPEEIKVTEVQLNKNNLNLEEGQSETLVALVLPVDATNKNVSWESSNPNVAIVNQSGLVEAVLKGIVIITTRTEDGNKISECILNVTEQEEIPNPEEINVTDVNLNKNALSLKIGNQEQLEALILPSNATNKNITWSSSNVEVASVDQDGNITALSQGTSIITVFTEDGGFSNTCTVTVSTENEEPIITNYQIAGKAWFDENKNGQKDSGEVLLSNIKVSLINKVTGEFLKNPDNSIKTVTTGITGYYMFDELVQGEYIVVFEYDNSEYTVTHYQKIGVANNVNSDVQNRTLLINEESKLVAITDTINITNQNQNDIDIGLIQNARFDLSLNKEVAKIIIQNNSVNTTYNYPEKTKLAKVEIRGKDIENSIAIIEYTISVTNEGDVTGFVDGIVDNIPKELVFNSEMNPTWYIGQDGKLYNSEMISSAILPGQTKNIKLILTKILNQESIGLITNTSEILSSRSLEGIIEYDSIAGNNNPNEDDFSKADVLIAIKTGGIELYIFITILSMTILSIGVYIINKKVFLPDFIKGGK